MCIVGTDRTLSNGDVCNKIGTYLKALSAKDNNVPFYVALPSSTIDWSIKDHKQIPIEERNSEELSHVEGVDENKEIKKVRIYPQKSKSLNLAFDVTPAKLVTRLITEKGIKVHVWVDETRPRNQGANLTSYELNEEGIPNTIITDNAGGILMQRGQVDMCIVGTDRTLSNGDVCNKIGTYLKALSAKDNNVPFYVALPSSTIDLSLIHI